MHASEKRCEVRDLPIRAAPEEVIDLLGDLVTTVMVGSGWGGAILALEPARRLDAEADPFAALDEVTHTDAPKGAVAGGWFGAIGYPAANRLEDLPTPLARDRAGGEGLLAYHDAVVRYDAASERWTMETSWTPARSQALERIYREVCDALVRPRAPRRVRCSSFRATPEGDVYLKGVATVLDRIGEGEFFQANLAMRAEGTIEGDPLALFLEGVRRHAPARAALVRRGTRAIVSFSPETFLDRRGTLIATEPIKGTRPIDGGWGASELASSEKDRAENIMIVDLMRNDLGRICRPGSVIVPSLCEIQAHPGVWHLVSRIEGHLLGGLSDGAVMRACFPPGSVTGAPKLRAMETIAESEPWGREIYTGCIGFATAGWASWSVAIRTFEIEGDRIWFGVGGGIVADSDPELEYRECLTKAAPLLEIAGAGWSR